MAVMVMVDCVKKIDPHLLYVMNELARIQQDTARVNKPPIVLVLNKVTFLLAA